MLEKVVIVKKPTKIDELLKRHTTLQQVKYILDSRNESYARYKELHDAYHQGLQQVSAAIPYEVNKFVITREQSMTYQFSPKELVIAVGDDGVFVNLAKYVGSQPVIVVNPHPRHSSATLASCAIEKLGEVIQKTLVQQVQYQHHTMVEATLDDGQSVLGLNDIFIGRRTHVSALYRIAHEGKEEAQSSSGIIICTGTGSTAWMKSKKTEVEAYGGAFPQVPYDRSSRDLVFAVREPYPSVATTASIIHGIVTGNDVLTVVSQMPENGCIYSDGMEEDYLNFPTGARARIRAATQQVRRVI